MDRDALVSLALDVFKDENKGFGEKLKHTVTSAMEFVGAHDWSGADKKDEVLKIIAIVLDKTDSPGPDWAVDKALMWGCEWAIDAIYDAFKGKFKLDG